MKNNNKSNVPVGFTMNLAQSPQALNYYSNLSEEERNKINNYIESSTSGNEAKKRIENVISNLENNHLNTLF